MNGFSLWGDYPINTQLTNASEQVQADAMTDAQLEAIVASAPSARAGATGRPHELTSAARAELTQRRITRQIGSAGLKGAVVGGAIGGLSAAALGRPKWWVYAGVTATVGYLLKRIGAHPRGSW